LYSLNMNNQYISMKGKEGHCTALI